MSNTHNPESQFRQLLEKEKLADLSQFHKRGFFDEVPLYSRESDVNFLPASKNMANKQLLRFALEFLNSVITYKKHPSGFFAAITVWDCSEVRLVPSLFFWCGGIQELKGKLALDAVTTPFGKQIKKMISQLPLNNQWEVLEDTATCPDASRVFIAPVQPPYLGFATLDTFRRPANALN